MISDKMQERLNKQLNVELQSAYQYVAMSAYCQSISMVGAAHWFSLQVREELAHATKFFNYITNQEGRVQLLPLAKPEENFASLHDVFEKTLAHEKFVTAELNDLIGFAMQHKDHATYVFLQWFLTEQVEEEATVATILASLKLAGNNGQGLLLIDRELGGRQPEADAE